MHAENQTPNNDETIQAISAFEQILQVVPDDMFALEALHDAYLGLGDNDRAYEYLARLANIASNSNDHDLLLRVSDKLMFLEMEHPEASALSKDLNDKARILSKDDNGADAQSGGLSSQLFEGSIHQEIALAWKLYENQQISKTDYSNITNDLTETSARNVEVPVTVMHVLQDRAVGNTEKIIAYIARSGATPLISLANFQLRPDAAKLLPSKFMSRLGALPIDFIEEELMVAILNPFNKELRESVERNSGRKCHFYLTTAPDYDRALQEILKMIADEDDS
jgi:tetratricopeptide (TPR) repeat protein